jgi:hypothetical protein
LKFAIHQNNFNGRRKIAKARDAIRGKLAFRIFPLSNFLSSNNAPPIPIVIRNREFSAGHPIGRDRMFEDCRDFAL